jgi:choline-sulfatase
MCKTDHLSIDDRKRIQAYYYGLVSWIDSQVGFLLDYLSNKNDLDNSIIVFEADHGVSLGEGGRYHKLSFAPESHRVPRIIYYPKQVPQDKLVEELTDSIDLARTLFGLVGIEPPEQFKGRDLFSEPGPPSVFSTIGYGSENSYIAPFAYLGRYTDGRGWPRRTCIRTQNYRLDKNVRINGKKVEPEDEDIFLADYVNDPDEIHNLALFPEYRNVVTKLSAQIDEHTRNATEPPPEYIMRPEMSKSKINELREVLLDKFESYHN